MKKKKPLVNGEYLLKKFPGKGGWTYADIPEIPQDRKRYFGWVSVNGFIDDFELNHFKLMPKGDGQLMLSVKSEIRKKIKKEAGDYVHIILYPSLNTNEIPDEILQCFDQDDPQLLKSFKSFSEKERTDYLEWIYAGKNEDEKASRILEMMERLAHNLKLYN